MMSPSDNEYHYSYSDPVDIEDGYDENKGKFYRRVKTKIGVEVQYLEWDSLEEFRDYIGKDIKYVKAQTNKALDTIKHKAMATKKDKMSEGDAIELMEFWYGDRYKPDYKERLLQMDSLKDETGLIVNPENYDCAAGFIKFYYVSDIHIDHKIKNSLMKNGKRFKPEEIVFYITRNLVNYTNKNIFHFSLIAGDTSFTPSIAQRFYQKMYMGNTGDEVIHVLGNHELWSYDRTIPFSNFINLRKKEWSGNLLHDDLLLYMWEDDNWNFYKKNRYMRKAVYSYYEVMEMTDEELRTVMKRAIVRILGGTGFSAYSNESNASTGIYRGAITPEEDMKYTMRFETMYKRIRSVCSDLQVIVLTHTPKESWSKEPYVSNWMYVNGHTHNNRIVDNQEQRVYSDNQIGYNTNWDEIHFKQFSLDPGSDIFSDLEDGIYPVSREDFIRFHQGRGIIVNFNRKDGTAYLLKRKGLHFFVYRNNKDVLFLMKGGRIDKAEHQDMEYYYENLEVYSNAIEAFMVPFTELEKKISGAIRKIGGLGRIHGAIVDIDFYNHIYVNPFDGTLTPYYALDKRDKWAYEDVPSLLADRLPHLYKKLETAQKERPLGKELSVISGKQLEISDKKTYVNDEEIYDYNLIIYNFQRIRSSCLIREWDEHVLNMPAKDAGKEILLSMKIENNLLPNGDNRKD
ncbi:MAG: metallophosphoesterase [Candidatus Methanomethylophilaceae archaeon]|nr:metallophosphoesterase [Candidatus Methanomethylophilaceae archaeon]